MQMPLVSKGKQMIEKTHGEKQTDYHFALVYSQVKRPIRPIDLILVLVCFVLQPAVAIGTNIALNTSIFNAIDTCSCRRQDSHYAVVC